MSSEKQEAPLGRPETYVQAMRRVKWGENNQPQPSQAMQHDRYLIQMRAKKAGKKEGMLGLTKQQMEEYAEMMRSRQQPELEK